jgi:hypothetical protein
MPKKGQKLATGVTRQKAPELNSLISQLEEPRSFMNLLPPELQASVMTIDEKYLNHTEDSFKELFQYEGSTTIEALRVNFWMEHDRVAATKSEVMNMAPIYLGVCSRTYFYRLLDGRPTNDLNNIDYRPLGYILTRPIQYDAMMQSLNGLAVKKLRDILNLPVTRLDGTPQDAKTLDIILKASAMVDLRVRGNYTQRSETKNLTYMETNSKIEQKSYTTVFNATSSEGLNPKQLEKEIDDKIKALEAELSGQNALPDPSQMPKPVNFSAATQNGNSPEPSYLSGDAHTGSGDDLAEFREIGRE